MEDPTLLVHGVEFKDPYNAINFPLYLSSTYYFDSAEHAKRVFSKGAKWPTTMMEKEYVYARGATPTTRALELLFARLHGGKDAVVFDSGMRAIDATLQAVGPKRVIIALPVYGETFWIFKRLESEGKEVIWFSGSNQELLDIIKEKKPNAVYFETPSNPTLKVWDIRAVAEATHEVGGILIVDNTFASPILQKPLLLGADVVVESLTKFFSGHSDVLGGAVTSKLVEIVERVREVLFVSGGVLSSFNAWLFLRSVKTMHLRLKAQIENAKELVKLFEEAGYEVLYPGVEQTEEFEIARRQMKDYGAIFSVLLGSYERARAFVNSLKIAKRAVSLGAVETLVNHPASMTHSMVPKEYREKMGITDDLVRVSVGVEAKEDLLQDFSVALKKSSL